MVLFTGQIERIDFTIEQVRVLGSVIRSEVFSSFNRSDPRSVAEVAAGLGKSASTVHYHTNELVEVGLLIAVEERKSHARIEKLYVHKGMDNYNQRPVDASDDYREEVISSFNAASRMTNKEFGEAYRSIGKEPEIWNLVGYQSNNIRVSVEAAEKIKRLMYAFRESLLEFDDPDGECCLRTSVLMVPSIETTRKIMKRKKKSAPKKKD